MNNSENKIEVKNKDFKIKKVLFIQTLQCIRTYKVAKALHKKGVQVDIVYTHAHPGEVYKDLKLPYTNIYRLQNIPEMINFINESDYDILYSSNEPDYLTVLFTTTNKPIVHDCHDMMSLRGQISVEQIILEYMANVKSDGNIYINSLIKDIAVKKFGLEDKKILCLHSYVEKEHLPQKYYEKLSSMDNEIHCVFEGGLVNAEGHHRFLENIFLKLAEEKIHVHLYSPGKSEYFKYLNEKSNNYIHWEGVKEPHDLITEMTKYDMGLAIFNLTERNKIFLDTAFPNKIWDYLAAGLPILFSELTTFKMFCEENSVGNVLDLNGDIKNQAEETMKISIDKDLLVNKKWLMDDAADDIIEFLVEVKQNYSEIYKTEEKNVKNANIVSISKVMNFINTIEEKFPVDKWIIDNVHVWPLIRITICAIAVTPVNISKKTNNYKSQDICNNKYLSEMEKYYKDDEWTKKKVDAVFLGRTSVRTRVNNLWYSKFCDYLIEQCSDMSLDTLFLEYSAPFSEYRYPVYRPIVPIQNYLNTFDCKDLNLKSMKYELEGYTEFLYELNNFYKETGYPVYNCTIANIMSRVKIIRNLADFFKMIFAKTKPEAGFVVCYYNNYGFAFNLACKECGILSVDIQHGVQEDMHFSYGRWNNIPEGGYEVLPSVFWNWNKESSNVIEKWNKECKMYHDSVVGGNPWIDMCKKDNYDLLANENLKILDIMSKENGTVNILYTHTSNAPISELILKTIESSPNNWRWWIRFHPCASDVLRENDIQLLKKCNNNNVEWKQATELPLLAWMNQVDVHITVYSTCVKEAVIFGVSSILTGTDEMCNHYYHREIDSGMAVIAHKTDEVISHIKFYANKKSEIKGKKLQECNARKALEKLLLN